MTSFLPFTCPRQVEELPEGGAESRNVLLSETLPQSHRSHYYRGNTHTYAFFSPTTVSYPTCLIFHPGREARADEDDGAGRFLVVSLYFSLKYAGNCHFQAADPRPQCGADSRPLRQCGQSLVHHLRGCTGASGLHSGDPSRQSSGPSLICEP